MVVHLHIPLKLLMLIESNIKKYEIGKFQFLSISIDLWIFFKQQNYLILFNLLVIIGILRLYFIKQ